VPLDIVHNSEVFKLKSFWWIYLCLWDLVMIFFHN
jgi:hypothetical protein